MEKLIKNKKGLVGELIMLIIIGFVIVIFFAGWEYGIGLVNTELSNIPGDSDATNISSISGQTFGYYNAGLGTGLKIISVALMFAYILATFIIAYYSSEHPVMFIVYFILALLLIILSVYLSNTYETLLGNDTIGSKMSEYTIVTHIMMNLTTYMIVITAVGMILMVTGAVLRKGQ